jgi:hypothetical protein
MLRTKRGSSRKSDSSNSLRIFNSCSDSGIASPPDSSSAVGTTVPSRQQYHPRALPYAASDRPVRAESQ